MTVPLSPTAQMSVALKPYMLRSVGDLPPVEIVHLLAAKFIKIAAVAGDPDRRACAHAHRVEVQRRSAAERGR